MTCEHEKLYPDEEYKVGWNLMTWKFSGLTVNICKKCMLLYAEKKENKE